jgi:hypothetical protein
MLTGIWGICVAMAVVCVLLGLVVMTRALSGAGASWHQAAVMLSVGVLIGAAAHAMWNYERWGRNVAVAITVCLGWIMAEWVGRRFGGEALLKLPVAIFAAVCLAYFTSAGSKAHFAKVESDAGGSDEIVG